MEYQVNYYNKKQGRAKSLLLGLFLGLLFLGAGTEAFIGYKLVNNPATLGISAPQPSTNSSLSIPAKPGLQTFVSQKYAYGFYYQPFTTTSDGSRLNLAVSELDSGMIVVYDDQTRQPTRVLEVFQKDPTDSLADAIKKQLFNGLAPNGCVLNTAPTLSDKNFPGGLIAATLEPPKQASSASSSATPKTTCPVSYIQTDSAHPRFFLSDPKHPTSFLFVDASQNLLQAKSDSGQVLNWFDTLTFIDK